MRPLFSLTSSLTRLFLALLVVNAIPPAALGQEGRLVREKVHGKSLQNSVTGELADRNVAVYLPPGYDKSPTKRYPVVYLLHGIMDTENVWIVEPSRKDDAWGTIPGLMNRGIAEGRFGEMIVVMPDQKTKFGGSFYTNSKVTGNWEDFTIKDLVSHVDSKYRTIPRAFSRGIAGHSMGGYGAITLGMKHPDVFSVVYGLNPAVLGWSRDLTIENPGFANVLKVKTPEEALQHGIYTLGIIVVGQAFSPNPSRPPFFFDPPFAMVGARLQPSEPAFSMWQDHLPVKMVDTYWLNLSKLRGLRFDSGYEDEFLHIPPTARALST